MSEKVLVAGATGYVGRHLVQALHGAGYQVRALVRSQQVAEAPGAYGAPALSGLVDEWVVRDITADGQAEGLCEGVDRVVSALGVTRQKADPWDVDFLGNLRLLEDAERHGAQSFCYVNVMNVWSGQSMILRSKAAFTTALTRSRLKHQVINPSGYFSDLSTFLSMARTGVVMLPPQPDVQLSPIHGADVAAAFLEKMLGASGAWYIGGPEVLTYRDVTRLAFEALGKKERTVTMPLSLTRGTLRLASHLDSRSRNLAQFFADGLTQNSVGKLYGQHALSDYFKALVQAGVEKK